jgi:nitroreductase
MEFSKLVEKNRSYRRFDGGHRIEARLLRDLVALARITPSAANKQPLKFILSCSAEWNAKINETLRWAGYLPEWGGPVPAERPTAHIIVLLDTTIANGADMDVGIVSQTMLLGAVDRGLGGCMLANVDKDALARTLGLPEHLKIALVIALGKPVERVILEDLPAGGSIKYYRDATQGHHVPKRPPAELVFKEYA